MKTVRISPSPSSSAGFTLVEMIIVVVLTGIVAGMVAVFIRSPMEAYGDTVRRARLTEVADTALRQMSREIRSALPNSVNLPNATALVMIPTAGGGRYRQYPTIGGAGDILNLDAADNSFDVLGPVPTYGVGNSLVIYNEPDAGRDAYAGNNRQALAPPYPAANLISNDVPAFTVTLTAALNFSPGSPSARFHIVQPPVIFVCTPSAVTPALGTLTRHTVSFAQAAAFIANPATPLPAGALLATGVTACTFTYTALGQRTALVTLWLGLGEAAGAAVETVTLMMQTHLNNQP